MLFLIEYNRIKGKIVRIEQFQDSDKLKAEKLKLDIELNLNKRSIVHEVVLLDAVDKDALLQTHQRYFRDINQISGSMTSL